GGECPDPPAHLPRQVDVRLDQPPEAVAADVLPGQPQLQRPPATGALEPDPPEAELARGAVRIGLVTTAVRVLGSMARAVVLGSAPAEPPGQGGLVPEHQAADVVRLE